jgi:hypothetical protein
MMPTSIVQDSTPMHPPLACSGALKLVIVGADEREDDPLITRSILNKEFEHDDE